MKNRIILLLVFFISFSSISFAQKMKSEDYIKKYKTIAIKHRFKYNIPAAIILAQGILESGVGGSYLAVNANNHFGIKCHNDWVGKRIYKDDDAKDECFRVYDSPEESYRDHALFLIGKSRYAFLFEYKVTQYKKWAKGLKKAGYATDPKYPKRLIGLIERYDLSKFDKISKEEFQKSLIINDDSISVKQVKDDTSKYEKTPIVTKTKVSKKTKHTIKYRNRVKYIIVNEGESIMEIARFYNIYPNRIYKYNDLKKGTPLRAGMMLYIQPKRRKGDMKYHIVKKNETLWQISQQHGIKLKWLKKRNHFDEPVSLKIGDALFLKKKKPLKKK